MKQDIILKGIANTWRQARLHLLVWTAFIMYEISFIYLMGIDPGRMGDIALHYLINISLFYANTEGFKFIFRHRYNRFVAILMLILLEIGVYILIEHYLFLSLAWLFNYHSATARTFHLYYIREIYRSVYFIGFSVAYWFAMRLVAQQAVILQLENNQLRQENRSAELQRNLMQSKNAYLQSQLSPHLLFNTLSFIYNSVRKLSASASSAILLLSEMMRYSLSEAGVDGKVSLAKEIEHIENLVRLNQLRFDERLNLQLEVSGISADDFIIPLLLLSFIENVYKHGDLADPVYPAKISIHCAHQTLALTCSNKKTKSKPAAGWGIGIANARARLNMYYPDKYQLNIIEDGMTYRLELTMQL